MIPPDRIFTRGDTSDWRAVDEAWEPETVFDVLASEEARRILALAAAEPHSAEELAERTGASLPTIYRRVNALADLDLLSEETRIDPDGNHYRTFETDVERISLEIGDGDLDVSVERPRDVVDRFGDFWADLERLSGEGDG